MLPVLLDHLPSRGSARVGPAPPQIGSAGTRPIPPAGHRTLLRARDHRHHPRTRTNRQPETPSAGVGSPAPDADDYRNRNQVERLLNDGKQRLGFAIAIRYDRLAVLDRAAAVLNA